MNTLEIRALPRSNTSRWLRSPTRSRPFELRQSPRTNPSGAGAASDSIEASVPSGRSEQSVPALEFSVRIVPSERVKTLWRGTSVPVETMFSRPRPSARPGARPALRRGGRFSGNRVPAVPRVFRTCGLLVGVVVAVGAVVYCDFTTRQTDKTEENHSGEGLWDPFREVIRGLRGVI